MKSTPIWNNIYFQPSESLTRLESELESLEDKRDPISVKRANQIVKLISKIENWEDENE